MRIIAAVLFFCGSTFAQFTSFHPELNWFTLKGEKVDVHYHEGAERTANVVKKIMEDIWAPITSLYDYEPQKVHFVIKDIDDYSNGATYFFDNKIEIWTSALDFDLRGSHNWLRNVISHEFTHLVQIQASLKASRSLPAIYLQWLNYEDERRPDILYGFPNIIASYPLASLNIPAWFAEGTAQYMRKEFDYDNWDAHRDMILRSYALEDKLLTWNQMGVFEKTSLGNESVYNSGFALVKYIAQKYGEDKLRIISQKLGKPFNFTMDAAIMDAIGISGNELYNEWISFLKSDYRRRTEKISASKLEGEIIGKEGFGNFYPVFSQKGDKVYYISNKGKDYLSQTSLYSYNLTTKEDKLIATGTRSTVDWLIPDEKIVYSKLSEDNPNSYNVHDLYSFEIATEKEIRLTNNMRANNPAVSPDKKMIVFVFQKDGTTNLGLVDAEGKNFRQITLFTNGEQVYNPKFSPDGSKIIFDYTYHHGRDVAQVSTDGSGLTFILKSSSDERNAIYENENILVYSSDETGIFNLYRYDLKSGEKSQLTNVLGGAFMPNLSADGSIVYSLYTADGYKIATIPKTSLAVASGNGYMKFSDFPLGIEKPNGDITNFNLDYLREFKDRDIPKEEAGKYRGAFSKLTFFPFIRFDNYSSQNKIINKFKPGVYLTSSDILNRFSFFAGGASNSRLEYDLFLIFDYKERLPLLFQLGLKPELALELYNVVRKVDTELLIEEYPAVTTDVSYNLFEVNLVARHRMFTREDFLEFRYIYSSYTAGIGSFISPIDQSLSPKFYDTYLVGSNFQLKYDFNVPKIYIDSDINPLGFKASVKYNYEKNEFNPDGEYTIEDGVLKPDYKDFNFHKLETTFEYGFSLYKKNSINFKLKGGTIFGPAVPDFFDFYIGGLTGIRAYSFYSISGNEFVHSQISLRLPLFREIDAKIGHIYLDKIYLILSGDAANAWTGALDKFKGLKKGVSAEVRFSMTSYYLFPTALFINASYGLDEFKRQVRDVTITYGKELRLYGGILFGFDF